MVVKGIDYFTILLLMVLLRTENMQRLNPMIPSTYQGIKDQLESNDSKHGRCYQSDLNAVHKFTPTWCVRIMFV